MKKQVKKKPSIVAVSGGFDPLHIGHVRMFQEAKKLGEKLVVIINNDNWLKLKKGFVFMPEKERKELIESFDFVDDVVLTDHKKDDTDMSVVRTLARVKPHIFANGGDRDTADAKKKNSSLNADQAFCAKHGIKLAYSVGRGGKVQSSSWIINAARKPASRTRRPWGEYYAWDAGKGWNLKTIYIKPKSRLSLQYHHHREEWWMLVEGDASATIKDMSGEHTVSLRKGEIFRVLKGQVHRLSSQKGGVVVEVAYGTFDENDIVRIEDDHGRV
jgi:cytidyltransferase-like protein